jgi:hypothetical protein
MSIEPTFGLVFGVTRMPKEGILPPVWVLYLGPVAIVADAWEKGRQALLDEQTQSERDWSY